VSPRGAAARTFVSLKQHRNYRLWFAGQIVSLTGTWVQNVAFAWYVISVTNSALATGVLIACQFTPYLLFGLFGGGIADKRDVRKILVITQSANLVVAAVTATVSITGHLSVLFVDIAAVLIGVVQVFDSPARQSFTVQMVGRKELPNALALNMSLFNTSRAIGPGIGGVLLATAGVSVCFVVNALSFLAVLVALLMMNSAELFRPVRSVNAAVKFTAGMAHAWRHRDTRMSLALLLVVSTLGFNMQTLLPVLAKKTILAGPATFGWLLSAFSVGAIGGGLVVAAIARPRWKVLLGAGSVYALGLIALAPMRTVLPALIALFIAGVGFAIYGTMSNATVQLNSPDHLRGRVMAIYAYFFLGTTPIGALISGWLADRSTALAFEVTGGISLAAVLTVVVIRYRGSAPRTLNPPQVAPA
jgi:MFS family permease